MVFVVLAVSMTMAICTYASGPDINLSQELEQIIHEVQSIKVGMTREDLLKVLQTEGGIYSRKSQIFVYPACPCIKVEVVFDPVGEEKGSEEDKIKSISKPFLELPKID